MHRSTLLFLALSIAIAPASAGIDTFPDLLDAMVEAQERRAEGVRDYAVDLSLLGHDTTQYFERVEATADDGGSFETFRMVPFDEIERRREAESGMTPEAWQAYGDGLRRTGDALGSEYDRGLAEAGLPPGLLGALGPDPGEEPWASPDPRVMLGALGSFADAAGAAQAGSNGTADGAASNDDVAALASRMKLVGRESLDGREAFVAKAEGLDLRRAMDGGEIVVRTMTLWVDTERLVPLRMRMDGIAKHGGEEREMVLERIDRDYRSVPGTGMLLPYRTAMRMRGMLGPEEQEQMAEAKKQLEELDRQMASMPPDQRAMVESRMGSQIEMIRNLAEGGAFEIETVVREVRVNQGLAGVLPATPPATREAPVAEPVAEVDEDALRRAREACLQSKIEEAEAAKKKKKRFGKLVGAVGRIAGRHAPSDVAADVARVSADVYDANATAEDLADAAEALGLTPDDVAECENPG